MQDYNIQILYNTWTIPPVHKNNSYIMELLADVGLKKHQLFMYLHIMTVAELANHTGTQLWLQALSHKPSDILIRLDSISMSLLEWPCIHCPVKTCWKLWTSTIYNQLTGSPMSNWLCHPLGKWTFDYQTISLWKWCLSHMGQLWHQMNPNTWPKATIHLHTQHHQLHFSLPVPTNQMF